MLSVELICVGTELLLGNIVNTNAAYLSRQCAALGLSCYHQSVVGDNRERLLEAVRTAVGRSNIVLLSGGLGPTQDDLTKETVAEVFGKQLVEDARSRMRIADYFSGKGMKVTENNWKQALVPEGCTVLDNDNGTAPGILIHENNTHVILLPGPPGELIPMFENTVLPYLKKMETGVILSKTVKICGVSESMIATQAAELIETMQNPTVAPYAKNGEVHLRVTAQAADAETAEALTDPVVRRLQDMFGDDIYAVDTDDRETTLESSIAALLTAHGLSVTTAESCTGGMIAARLVNVPGVSGCFQSGYVTYANEAKERMLFVQKETLEKYGAVSPQTAAEMAAGAVRASGADVSISVTGIAGPDGGSEEKPVGLVYMGCQVDGKMNVKELHQKGGRARVRESTTAQALIFLRKCIIERYGLPG